MILFFGWGSKNKRMGNTYLRSCSNCHNQRVWTIIKHYKYFSIFFIPLARWGQSYLHMCPICETGEAVSSRHEALAIIAQSSGDAPSLPSSGFDTSPIAASLPGPHSPPSAPSLSPASSLSSEEFSYDNIDEEL